MLQCCNAASTAVRAGRVVAGYDMHPRVGLFTDIGRNYYSSSSSSSSSSSPVAAAAGAAETAGAASTAAVTGAGLGSGF